MLKWHYRSRHESLITVSNREFYDNDLLVYPSPSHNDPELGLKFHYNPNTAYHRGSSSANPLEAEDVAEEIFNHFEKYGDTKSLGVGTFSVAQKNAILEALEVKRKERPEFEPLFSENKEERFFVKNLETIQGDERDVILISVGYGYDQDGKMSLNFGPLNQDGGERRLNVLITRAREKCVVFSNFKAYDMKLTANPPYGVRSLREFLEYAENLTLGTKMADEFTKEPFEDAIASFLEENGYTVDRQIGCAGFRVDLAIVDDENPGKYILGITTDGKMYSSSKVARDRDRLREQVLTGLGWKLYHLWSTDWYRNRDLGRKKLLENIEKSIRRTREEEKRRSEEEKKLAEKRRLEAEKKAEELRLAREKEEKERAENESEENDVNAEDVGPSDFVEVEKVDDGDIFEKPIDVSEIDPKDLFGDEGETTSSEKTQDNAINEESSQKETPSEFVVVDAPDEEVKYEETPSEFVVGEDDDVDLTSNDKGNDETIEEASNIDVSDDDESSSMESSEIKQETSVDDKEVWEVEEEPSNQNDDAEVWESDEGVSPEDNAEVWENDKDYSDDESEHVSFKEKVKSLFKHDNADEDSSKSSFFSGLSFEKDLGENSDLEEDELDDKIDDEKPIEDDKVDLGSDDDYIYVDHSDDEVVEETEIPDDSQEADFEDKPQGEVKIQNKSKRPSFVKSIISEVVSGEPRLESEEIKVVRGDIMEEDGPLHKPAPKDDYVVEAEIVNGQDYSSEEILEKPTPRNYFEEDEELNIFTDELPDLSNDGYDEIHEEATRVIDKAMSEFMKGVFESDDLDIQEDGRTEESINDKFVDEEIIGDAPGNADDSFVDEEVLEDNEINLGDDEEIAQNDGNVEEESTYDEEIVYFKGANDVTNPLRKNNVYYNNEHKNKSLRDSIKGIKKDMQYINKSLNEIENPTQIDYVSVVDRTEDYDPNDYLSRPSDDDSDKIIQMEEEQRTGNEFIDVSFEGEIPGNDDVIVTVNDPNMREELKDQALEDIIQTANDDYKEIEKERFQSANKLKAFDDQKLPGKKKMEDEIIDYVQATDIGLTPQNDLYAQPISKVAQSVKNVVDIEGPIHIKEVTARIKDSCNIKRAGSNLKKTVKLAVDEAENSGDIIRIGDFLYDASNNNVVIRKRNKPNIDLISDEEIAKSIELVLIHKQNVSTKQIAKEASRNFGFKSTSKKTASRINGVLDLMIANNSVKIVNDYVELN